MYSKIFYSIFLWEMVAARQGNALLCFGITFLVTALKGYLILFHSGMGFEPKIKNPF